MNRYFPNSNKQNIRNLANTSVVSHKNEYVIAEDEAHRIQQNLENAEERLRLLSGSSKLKMRQQSSMNSFSNLNTNDKTYCKQRRKKSSCFTVQSHTGNNQLKSSKQKHFDEIRMHLEALENWRDDQNKINDFQRNQDNAFSKLNQQKHYCQQINRLQQEMISIKRRYEDSLKYQKLERSKQIALIKQSHSLELRQVQARQKEQLQQLKIEIESYYLTKQEELINQLDKQNLEQQLNQQKLKCINLQNYIRKQQNDMHSYEDRIQEIEQETNTLKESHDCLITQIQKLNKTMEVNARQTIRICELILYSADVLNRINNSELLATIVMIKEQYNIKRPAIRSLVADLKQKYCFPETDRCQRSSILKYRDDQNKAKKYISDDKSPFTTATTKDVTKQCSITSPFTIENQYGQLYHMLLIQAVELENSCSN